MEERRSRFIATCCPLETEQDAVSFIDSVSNEFPDASHHVYAWLLGRDLHLQRYSDAGEPHGTAGLPVMRVLEKNDLLQTGLVVTRYFGGIQLGAGGLGRAYSASASMAVRKAGILEFRLCRQYIVTVEYTFLESLRRNLLQAGYSSHVSDYGMDAELRVDVPDGLETSFERLCNNTTSGAALVEPAALVFRPLPPPDPPSV